MSVIANTIIFAAAFSYVLYGRGRLAYRYAKGYSIIDEGAETANLFKIDHAMLMLVVTAALLPFTILLTVIWPVVVPVAIVFGILHYFHEKNVKEREAVAILKGEKNA